MLMSNDKSAHTPESLRTKCKKSIKFGINPWRIQDFPLGGGRPSPTWALFGENVCENERIGSRWGGAPAAPPGSTNVNAKKLLAHRDF